MMRGWLCAEESQRQADGKQSGEAQMRTEQAAHSKAEGNKALKAQQYGEAVQHYSQAIELEASNPAHHNNRALAFLKVPPSCLWASVTRVACQVMKQRCAHCGVAAISHTQVFRVRWAGAEMILACSACGDGPDDDTSKSIRMGHKLAPWSHCACC